MSTRSRLGLAALASVAMTVFVTWPQVLHMGTHVASHQDPQFSIWRLAWFAHALAHDPRHLFSGNIFYPASNTLTFSDAMLVEGAIAAPLFWLGLPEMWIYNLMLLGAFAASGFAMFVLVHELTGRTAPSLFAALVFTMAPFRIEHFMHLELQWAMWVPLTFWALHLTLREESPRSFKYGLLAGLFVWLQIASCVYYGVFLSFGVAVFMAAIVLTSRERVLKALPALAAGGALALVLTAPYLWFYMNAARSVGVRHMSEIAVYSGRLWSYFSSPPQNLLWGWTATVPEANLFLGWSVMVIAVAGALVWRVREERVAYATVAVFSVVMSFGLNTPVYAWLISAVHTLQGLRAPARFGILTCCAVAVLAGFGLDAVRERMRKRSGRLARAVVPALFVLAALEYTNTGMRLMDLSIEHDGTVYRMMKSSGPGVVAELPMPTPGTLPGNETDYEMWSTRHWFPLVNGYSGYYPPGYIDTIAQMETFPDEPSIERLRQLDVRYVIVHCKFYVRGETAETIRDECPALLARIGERNELQPYGKYADPYGGPAYLFVLKP